MKLSISILSVYLFLHQCQANGDLDQINGYYISSSKMMQQQQSTLDSAQVIDYNAAVRPDALECPSENVITTTYRCQVGEEWTDCSRSTCCPDFTYVAGRCLPNDINPCLGNLCEQRCSVFFGRVVCTCFAGYNFNRDKHLESTPEAPIKACEDKDECQVNNGDCEQVCVNEVGSFRCACTEGYRLNQDNQTCTKESQSASRPAVDTITSHAQNGECSIGCHSILKMRQKVSDLEEMVRSLNTAIKLYSFAAGPPGPPGPAGTPGPPGPTGPRGFPGTTGSGSVLGPAHFGENYQHPQVVSDPEEFEEASLEAEEEGLDSFKMVRRNGKKHFCRCKRGPVGSPGAQGALGPRGPRGETGPVGRKGEPGSFDFFMLMMADLRHDLEQLQARVYPNRGPGASLPQYNMQKHLAWEQRMKDKHYTSSSSSLSNE